MAEFEVLRSFYCDVHDSIAHPRKTALLLFKEGVVSHGVLDDMFDSAKPLGEKTAAIMRAVCAAVIADPERIRVLIAVLEKFAKTAPVASRMRNKLRSLGLQGR